MRFFIRESIINLKKVNPEIWAKASGSTELFLFQSNQLEDPEKITLGDAKLVEVEIIVKSTGEKVGSDEK